MGLSLSLKEGLRPLSDLKARAGEVIRQVQRSGRPVVITRHGRGVAVIVSVEDFERYQAYEERMRIRRAVQEGLADAKAGRTTPHDEVVAAWEARLGESSDGERSLD